MNQTPVRNKLLFKTKSLIIPPSPQMQKLGYGTGVTVYKLERAANKSPWVLKKVSKKTKETKEMSRRLNFEASIMKTLKHPNIVGFRGLLQGNDGRNCIAMEDCTISLGDLIENRVDTLLSTPFPAGQIEKVLKDVAQGLKYLHHEALVLHCDIKSYNILIKNDFEVCKICDFGVSMPLKSDGTLDLEKAGDEAEYQGTGPWMAPEVLENDFGQQIITVKADIFAYGLVLWEMIALQPPYSEDCADLDDDFDESDKENSKIENSREIIDLCSESEDENETIDLDKSIVMRQRPKVPCEDLNDDYLPILQVFHLCTEQDCSKRPNAMDLCDIIENLKFTA